MKTRVAIAVPGVLLGLFGIFRLLTEVPSSSLVELLIWLVVAVALHDGVLSPIVVGVGWALSRTVPPRGRRYLQGGLIAASLVTVIALPLIDREKSGPASKALLRQDYTANLGIALAVIAVVTIAAYLVGIMRDRQLNQRARTANVRPADDQDSTTS